MRLHIQSFVLLILAMSARANVCPQREVKAEDPFAYATSLVDSLGWAQSAVSRMPLDEPPKSAEQQPGGDFVRLNLDQTIALKLIAEDYRCAAKSVADYQQSKTKAIAASAKTAYAGYSALIAYTQEMVKDHLHMLDMWSRISRGTVDAESIPNAATLAKSISDRGIKIDDAWQRVLYALPPAEWALVEPPSKESSPPSTLRIRSEQKKILLSAIESTFPKSKQGCEENPKYLDAAACLLHDFLTQEWKTLDNK